MEKKVRVEGARHIDRGFYLSGKDEIAVALQGRRSSL